MKKSLLALAVLGAFAGAANAQSSVTVYGIVDAGLVRESGNVAGAGAAGRLPASGVNKLTSGVESGSRLGFRGTEDLGNGLSGIFVLETGIQIDQGGFNQNNTAFGRQAFVGLKGNFGTVSLGRQYNPLHNALNELDPFGTGLAGSAENVMAGGSGAPGGNVNAVRMNNAIKYLTPDFSGFKGELAYAFGETAGNNRAGRQIAGSIGYANGPIGIKLTHSNARNSGALAANAADNFAGAAPGTDTGKTTLLSGTYNFGVAKAALGYAVNKGFGIQGIATPDLTVPANAVREANFGRDSRDYLVGVTVPFGASTFLASFINHNARDAQNADARQYAVGYTYAVSKRTDLYTSFARITNRNGAQFTVGNASEAGSGDKAFNVGVRHTF